MRWGFGDRHISTCVLALTFFFFYRSKIKSIYGTTVSPNPYCVPLGLWKGYYNIVQFLSWGNIKFESVSKNLNRYYIKTLCIYQFVRTNLNQFLSCKN